MPLTDSPDNAELVTIARYPDLVSAGLAKSQLATAEIFAFIPDETLIGLGRRYVPAFTGVALQVARRDAERAVALLQAYAAPAPAADRGAGPTATTEQTCPACGSTEVCRVHPLRGARIISALSFLLLLFSRRKYRCLQCGHRFAA